MSLHDIDERSFLIYAVESGDFMKRHDAGNDIAFIDTSKTECWKGYPDFDHNPFLDYQVVDHDTAYEYDIQ